MDTDVAPSGDKKTREESNEEVEGGFWQIARSATHKKKVKRATEKESSSSVTPGNSPSQEVASAAAKEKDKKKKEMPKFNY